MDYQKEKLSSLKLINLQVLNLFNIKLNKFRLMKGCQKILKNKEQVSINSKNFIQQEK
jgi:hypothetical protein